MHTRNLFQLLAVIFNAETLVRSNYRKKADIIDYLSRVFPFGTRSDGLHVLYGLAPAEAVHCIFTFVREQVLLLGGSLPDVPPSDAFACGNGYLEKRPEGKRVSLSDRSKLEKNLGYNPIALPKPLSAATVQAWWLKRKVAAKANIAV